MLHFQALRNILKFKMLKSLFCVVQVLGPGSVLDEPCDCPLQTLFWAFVAYSMMSTLVFCTRMLWLRHRPTEIFPLDRLV